jgi:para-aminobenzoate synthetase/4-amino-4-deoxychorismate lyase
MGPQGPCRIQADALPTTPVPIHVQLASHPMPEADDFIRHKTTLRQAYAAFKPPAGCFDTLLYNAQGQLTEFTIGNVAVNLGGTWFTPPTSVGLLPGVMRQSLLVSGQLHERIITLDDLAQAQGMALINSVRGWLDVASIPLP